MLRKGSDLLKGDRDVLLNLDYGGEAQTTDSYGSLQNGCFIPPRYVSTILFFLRTLHLLQYVTLSYMNHINIENKWTFTQQPLNTLLPCLIPSLTSLRCCSVSRKVFMLCVICARSIKYYEVQYITCQLKIIFWSIMTLL